jgi:hypothetical protein
VVGVWVLLDCGVGGWDGRRGLYRAENNKSYQHGFRNLSLHPPVGRGKASAKHKVENFVPLGISTPWHLLPHT